MISEQMSVCGFLHLLARKSDHPGIFPSESRNLGQYCSDVYLTIFSLTGNTMKNKSLNLACLSFCCGCLFRRFVGKRLRTFRPRLFDLHPDNKFCSSLYIYIINIYLF